MSLFEPSVPQGCINLSVPRSKTSTYGNRSFAHSFPRFWNKLPDFIRFSETLESGEIPSLENTLPKNVTALLNTEGEPVCFPEL